MREEIAILERLDHPHIVQCHDYGQDASISSEGQEATGVVHIVFEYVPNGLLYDLCQQTGGLGEEVGRYVMH